MWSSILRSIRSGVRVGLVLLVLPVSANAQSGAGSGLSGRVTDISGAPMAGVTITVSRPDAGVERTAATSAAGDWEVRFLPTGSYRIAFEQNGFKTLRLEGVAVTTGQMATVPAVLEAYNLTNTPSFRNPVSDLGASNFGQITRTRGGPRLLQLGVKLRF